MHFIIYFDFVATRTFAVCCIVDAPSPRRQQKQREETMNEWDACTVIRAQNFTKFEFADE